MKDIKRERLVHFGNDRKSLDRPSWTQDDLDAYKHLHGKGKIVGYYERKYRIR